MSDEMPSNRLAEESSPYLLQHAENPVDWHPWGEAAFARARAEDKPIFLSIGYSTCHWCHVMAHESFESAAIAKVLNEHYISIKVDREERPDVDRVYMAFVQAISGSGGWPMSVWLTPDLQPFYGGTYFPPEDRWGRPGFMSILTALARVWREDRARVLEQGAQATKVLQQIAARPPGSADAGLDPQTVERAYESFRNSFDPEWGGFGGAPKFPRPPVLQLLARVHAMARDTGDTVRADEAAQVLAITLRHIVSGGMHDQLGGGFHRYSVDRTWHVPHFEKMLYDQAQITINLLEAYQITGDASFAHAARGALEYVLRDLTAPRGAFYSAEDADSRKHDDTEEKGEGAFYIWTADELRAVLGTGRAGLFALHHGVVEEGNAPDGSDPHGEFTGANILLARKSLADTARGAGMTEAEVAAELRQCREILMARRENRPRPQRDQKIIAAWNGLMISAFARAAWVFDDPLLIVRATRAAEYVLHVVWDGVAGVLHRSWCAGRQGVAGFAEDHAFLTQAFLDLYEASFEIRWLKWALDMQESLDRLFWDDVGGGYFSSAAGDASIIARMKEDHDGAEPAPTSVAVHNLLRLGRLVGDETFIRRAEDAMRAHAGTWDRAPQALPLMLAGLCDWKRPPRQIVIAGTPGEPDFSALLNEVRRRFLPGTVVLAADGGEGQRWLGRRIAATRDMKPVGGRAAAYVCESFTCQLPVTDPAALGALLDARK